MLSTSSNKSYFFYAAVHCEKSLRNKLSLKTKSDEHDFKMNSHLLPAPITKYKNT